MSKKHPNYGTRIEGQQPGDSYQMDWQDRDGDGVDDRWQRGPGRPSRQKHFGPSLSTGVSGSAYVGTQAEGGSSPYQDNQTTDHGVAVPRSAPRAPSSEERRAINNDPTHHNWAQPVRGGGGGGNNNGSDPAGMTRDEFLAYQRRQNRIEARQAEDAAAAAARQQGQSVYDWARSVFAPIFGPEMTKEIMGAVRGARSEAQALTEIRQTDAYKQRFAGNIARQKAGLPMLSEAEYLGLERSYRGSMRAAGLPKGFYDDNGDFADFIAQDVSPEEIARRADLAGDLGVTKNPALFKELSSRGLAKGDIAAYILDPDKSLPLIERKIAQAEMGAAARDAGMNFAKGNKFENKLVGKGITTEAASQAFAAAAEITPDINHLAQKYGEKGFTEKGVVKQKLGIGGKNMRENKARMKSLASQERAEWSGRAGAASNAFGGGGS